MSTPDPKNPSEEGARRPTDEQLAAALDVVRREIAAQPSPSQTSPEGRGLSPTFDPGTSTGRAEGLVSDVAIQMATMTSGPLPSSSEMAGYKAVDQALPTRIADSADDERQHRHKLEDRQSRTASVVSLVGVGTGFLFAVMMLGLAFYALHEDQPELAVGAIIVALVPVAVALINRGRD